MSDAPHNAMRNAEIMRRLANGQTYGQIGRALAVSRNVVAGVAGRVRHPRVAVAKKPFRDRDRVIAAVNRANEIGLSAAARELDMDSGQLCRWRQRASALGVVG